MSEGAYEPAQYLNVDLDIESVRALDALVAHLDGDTVVLHHERRGRIWSASFEFLPQPRDADRAIRAFVKILRRLPPAPRRQWRAARLRCFNIGVQAGMEWPALEVGVRAETLAGVAALGASLAVTVYPPARPTRRH